MMPGQERPDVNAGGKIIMPPSSLESLSRLNISFPMLFKVENKAKGRVHQCPQSGVDRPGQANQG